MLDYYEALGVEESAGVADIKKAWRSAQVEFHPDRNPGNKEAEERFKLCSEAYEVLSDEHRRRVYDMSRHVGPDMSIDPSILDDIQGENGEEIVSSFVKIFGKYLDDRAPLFSKIAKHFDDYEDRLEAKRKKAQDRQKTGAEYRVVTQGGITVRVPK